MDKPLDPQIKEVVEALLEENQLPKGDGLEPSPPPSPTPSSDPSSTPPSPPTSSQCASPSPTLYGFSSKEELNEAIKQYYIERGKALAQDESHEPLDPLVSIDYERELRRALHPSYAAHIQPKLCTVPSAFSNEPESGEDFHWTRALHEANALRADTFVADIERIYNVITRDADYDTERLFTVPEEDDNIDIALYEDAFAIDDSGMEALIRTLTSKSEVNRHTPPYSDMYIDRFVDTGFESHSPSKNSETNYMNDKVIAHSEVRSNVQLHEVASTSFRRFWRDIALGRMSRAWLDEGMKPKGWTTVKRLDDYYTLGELPEDYQFGAPAGVFMTPDLLYRYSYTSNYSQSAGRLVI
ncbi:hypothetical protein F5Y16DRAFT_127774 [Xylariaceae sp. FL0255]|nr:hypothetical protein F5Y16DRAFT_127774 [Xylariaceae sp. FL0255]